jgi:hypothetical protein
MNKPVTEVAKDLAMLPVFGFVLDALSHGALFPLGTGLGLAVPALAGYGGYRALKSIGESGGENAARLYQELGG